MPKTAIKKAYVPKGEIFSFYGGRVLIEKKPWGDHFRFVKVETGLGGMLSATACTKKLDKSQFLIPWAVGLVGSHIKSYFGEAKSETFSKEEIFLIVDQAIAKPEEKKVEGGQAGTIIHEYAHNFAKAVLSKTALPKFDHLDEKKEVEKKALNGINAFLDWYNSNHVVFIKMEDVVYYNSLLAGDSKEGEPVVEYVGIRDLFAKVNGQLEVIDYKSAKGIYSDQRYQGSGYFKAHNSNAKKEDKAKGVRILNFGKETGDLIQKFIPAVEVEKDFRAFVGLHMVATREAELEKEYRDGLKANTMKE